MSFAHPWLLLWIVPALVGCHVVFHLVDWRARRRLMAFLGDAYDRYRSRHGKPALWVPQRYFLTLCFVFLIVAAARPYRVPEQADDESRARIGSDFLLAIDASKSMLARDTETTEAWRDDFRQRPTQTPGQDAFVGDTAAERVRMRRARNMAEFDDPDSLSRLQAVKQAIRTLLDQAQGDRIGLLAFTEEASLRAPMTYDFPALELVLESINPGTVPPGGTSLESVIRRAHAVFEDKGIDRPTLVILSDGEDHEGDAYRAALDFRRELGGVIHAVGIGSPAGTRIRVQQGDRNPFVRDGFGRDITTRLDAVGLGRVARAAGGRYAELGLDGQGLVELYRQQIKPFGDATIDEFPPDAIELFQVPLAFALLSLVCEMLVRAKAPALRTQAIIPT